MTDDDRISRQIIKKHGAVLDLEKNPGIILDIIRTFGPHVTLDDGGLPGGVPPSPPPGPTSFQHQVTNDALMREILRLSRAVDQLTQHVKQR